MKLGPYRSAGDGLPRCGLTLAAACLLGFCAAAGRADELDDLVGVALSNSPAVRAAREGVRQAVAASDASGEFLDPAARVAAGRTSGDASVPLVAAPSGLPAADAYGVSGSLEVPLEPGVYLGAGVSEQYLVSPPDDADHLRRTLAGAQIRIPLWQDRGFVQWKQDRARLKDLRDAADARLLEVRQAVRHAVEQAYTAYLENLANQATAAAAVDRSRQLLGEAEELVRLKVVPEYQLAPARLELALRHEEAHAARQSLDTARLRLIQVLGRAEPPTLTTNAAALLERGSGVRLPPEFTVDRATAARGAARELASRAAAAACATRSLADRLRPDLALTVRGAWETDAAAGGSAPDDEYSSAAAVLVWSRPWHQTGPRGRLREAEAREAELAELQRELRNQLASDLATAHRAFAGAGARLTEISAAVEQARHTLDAEAERFRLGEGRSRNVLDAQNDLTKTYRSRNAIVAALLRSHSDFLYASGYNPDDSRAAGARPLGGDDAGYP